MHAARTPESKRARIEDPRGGAFGGQNARAIRAKEDDGLLRARADVVRNEAQTAWGERVRTEAVAHHIAAKGEARVR